MRNSEFYFFVAVALLIYGGINSYIFRRGWQALDGTEGVRAFLLAIFLFLVLSYPIGRSAAGLLPPKITGFLVHIGSLYLALMMYLLLLVLFVDLIRLANMFLKFFPKGIQGSSQKAAQVAFAAVLGAALAVVIYGYFNAQRIRLRTLDIAIRKPIAASHCLNIVMASDIHLGLIISCKRLEIIVDKINELEPDIVLLPGDIVDETVSADVEQRMVGILQKIRAPYGVYAVPGNHEYYSGFERAMECLNKGNVTVLLDRAVKIADAFYLLGRQDRSALRIGGKRKSLNEILMNIDHHLPLILLDHQPFHLEEAEQNAVDLQLSGHTHNGQLFPFDFINRTIYENSWGYSQRGNTHYYVSCGAGTWGPPARTAGVSEIVQIRMTTKR